MRAPFIALAIAVTAPFSVLAAPPQAAVCTACHGPAGISPNPEWPNIAGQHKPYLVSSLKAYRDGTRNNPLMSPIAKNLTDGDIDVLAEHFSSLPAQP